jgi:predicted NAD/FAD-binding protein
MQKKLAKQRIAIIGSGITGLAASWLLHKQYDVTLYEKNSYFGGHTHTHHITEDHNDLAIDSGFIVYNEKNYPNLVGLFNHLNIETQTTNMSFAFSLNQGELEYAGSGLAGLFAQKGNIIKIKHWRLIREILRFNKIAHQSLDQTSKTDTLNTNLSLIDFLSKHNFSDDLKLHYLLPMGAAIWSCPVDVMYQFPAHSFIRFFANHGLIDIKNRPQWRTVVGGSNQYIKKILADIGRQITFKSAAVSVKRMPSKVIVTSQDGEQDYAQVIFACHADEALELLEKPHAYEIKILSNFKYQENKTYLHTDKNLMPKRKKAWSAWNYLASSEEITPNKMTASYWMNCLQKLNTDNNYFVTLNPFVEPDADKVIREMIYHHPVFDNDAITAQQYLKEIQGLDNTWFCGSYTGYGFHEDALASSVTTCQQLGVTAPWVSLESRQQEAR